MPVEDLTDVALRAGHPGEGEHHEQGREGDHGDQRVVLQHHRER
ncbi:hypothetical protein [Streptomyces virginiae]